MLFGDDMPRIRTIKPEFPQSESMGRVSRDARLLFIMLWTLADDSGRLRGNSRMLASLLFPYDSDAPKHIDSWVDELVKQSCIHRYTIEGDTYIEVCKWLIHQKIDKPSQSKIPPFARIREDSANVREDSSLDQGPRIKDQGRDQGPRTKDQGSREKLAQPVGVSDSVWQDFQALRTKLKAPITQTALDGIELEAKKAGITLDDALRMCCERSWRGFKADWVPKADSGPPPGLDDMKTKFDRAIPPPKEILEKLGGVIGQMKVTH